ncbi:hypothetical protein OG554_05420 [Streptomyces griseus]|uniref:hypothetical protein n=1 Tax=Streptomyces griseus TaxID=1911 RepID=UPI00386857EB|nr:hypothetical protein OG554_05420 [Streptomyces fimicarius]
MPSFNQADQADQLHSLATGLEALHARVRDISYTPGTDARRQISPLLLTTHDLTATALARLRALDNSPYTTITDATRELMVSVAVSVACAGGDLAHVLLANPAESTPRAGNPRTTPPGPLSTPRPSPR